MHKSVATGCHSSAFTAVELVVAVAIVAGLAALALVGFQAARVRSLLTVDASNLRQIGQAAEMYASDHNGLRPLSVRELYTEGRLEKGIVVSPLGPTEEGIANRFVEGLAFREEEKERLRHRARTTYIGPGDGNWSLSRYHEAMQDRTHVGGL
jgi:type II secretory pathway pseudopilin PulG